MKGLGVDNVDTRRAKDREEGELVLIKVRQHDHGIFEGVRDVRIFDHLHRLPVFNDQHVGWTAADKEFVFCKLDWISSSFMDELD